MGLAQEAVFDVSKGDWLKYQAKQTLELSDEELEGVAGGAKPTGGGGTCDEGAQRCTTMDTVPGC